MKETLTLWDEYWNSNHTPWKRDRETEYERTAQELERLKPHLSTESPSIFVPLCGDTNCVRYLYDQGYTITALDGIRGPIDGLIERDFSSLECTEEGLPWGKKISVGERLAIYVGDIFEAALSERFDLIYDVAATVAIAPVRRAEYVAVLKRLLAPKGLVYSVTFDFKTKSEWLYPPYPVSQKELRRFYEPLTQHIFQQTLREPNERFQCLGVISDMEDTSQVFKAP